MNFETQEIKVDIKVGKNKRRITLGDFSGSPTYDVTEDVQISKKDGLATYDSIDAAARKLVSDLREGIYGEAE